MQVGGSEIIGPDTTPYRITKSMRVLRVDTNHRANTVTALKKQQQSNIFKRPKLSAKYPTITFETPFTALFIPINTAPSLELKPKVCPYEDI